MKSLSKILNEVMLLKEVNTFRKDSISYVVDYGKYKGSYVGVLKFDNGIMKKEYIISYGMVENNEKLIFEFRNISVDNVNEAKNILLNAIKDLKLV